MSDPELLPCPFCGSADVHLDESRQYGHGEAFDTFKVRCRCGAEVRVGSDAGDRPEHFKAEVVRRWNLRPVTPSAMQPAPYKPWVDSFPRWENGRGPHLVPDAPKAEMQAADPLDRRDAERLRALVRHKISLERTEGGSLNGPDVHWAGHRQPPAGKEGREKIWHGGVHTTLRGDWSGADDRPPMTEIEALRAAIDAVVRNAEREASAREPKPGQADTD